MLDVFILLHIEIVFIDADESNNFIYENNIKEIIQLCALKIEKKRKDYKIIDQLNYFIKQNNTSILSPFFIEKTGIDNNIIDLLGVSFNKCIQDFESFSKNKDIYTTTTNIDIIKKNFSYNSIYIHYINLINKLKPITSLYKRYNIQDYGLIEFIRNKNQHNLMNEIYNFFNYFKNLLVLKSR